MTESSLIAPHGGELVLNMADGAEQEGLRGLARSLPQLVIGSRQLADLEMLAIGAYSPLSGILTRDDYLSVMQTMHLRSGLPWSIPITLSTSIEQAGVLFLPQILPKPLISALA